MNTYEFIVGLTNALVWPVFILLVLFMLTWKYPGGSVINWIKNTVKEIRGPGGWGVVLRPDEQSIDESARQLDAAKHSTEIWRGFWWFELVWGRIYRSQVQILRYLARPDVGQVSIVEVLYFYSKAIEKYPDLGKYKSIDYLDFLKRAGFIKWEETAGGTADILVEITLQGRKFIKYIGNLKYDESSKPY
ncbi:MAG: hypothetical protein GY800_01845 [Planctomycetes bacterium]|nr:hypothetical protein [Planctomycetota bacterium]